MHLYLDNGYLDMRSIINHTATFIFLYGARGTGKTYGALEYVIKDKIKHLYMRRTQTQLDIINKQDFSPYKEPCNDNNIIVHMQKITKYNSAIYANHKVDGVDTPNLSDVLGYTAAMSTISNMRGFSASDIDLWIYDEFMGEAHERPIKNEGEAFLNAYETINRNRELQGRDPLKVICMANSNNIANPLFLELGLVNMAYQMDETNQVYQYYPDRGLLLINISKSPISKAKSTTALYKMVGDNSAFRRMSILNKFDIAVKSPLLHPNLKQLTPLAILGEIAIYNHKNQSKYILHICTHKQPGIKEYKVNDTYKSFYKKQLFWVWDMYMRGKVTFEAPICEVLLQKYFL